MNFGQKKERALMKNLLTVFVPLMIGCAPFTSILTERTVEEPSDTVLEGIWLGKLMVTEEGIRMSFEVTRGPDGVLTATMAVIEQDAFGIPVSAISLENKSVRLEIAAINCIYIGELQDESTITGTIQQGDRNPDELLLKLVDEMPVSAPMRPQEPQKPYPYDEEEVMYQNIEDNVTLAGTLTLPRSTGPHPAVVLIPGSGPNDRDETIWGHRVFLVLADYLTRHEIVVLRSDDRGVGGSTGDFSVATMEDAAEDAIAAVEYLKKRPEVDAKKIGLIGHSYGADVAPLAATQSSDIAFIVLMAGASNTLAEGIHLQCRLAYQSEGASEAGIALNQAINETVFAVIKDEPDNQVAERKIVAALESFNPKVAELSDEDRRRVELSYPLDASGYLGFLSPSMRFDLFHDTKETLRKVACPVLAINGDKDIQVPSEINLKGIEEALGEGGNPDYTVKVLPGLNHLFQTAETGAIGEYSKIEETISPDALDLIFNWVADHTGLTK